MSYLWLLSRCRHIMSYAGEKTAAINMSLHDVYWENLRAFCVSRSCVVTGCDCVNTCPYTSLFPPRQNTLAACLATNCCFFLWTKIDSVDNLYRMLTCSIFCNYTVSSKKEATSILGITLTNLNSVS